MRIRRKMEKEKEEDIWSRKIIGWQWRRKTIFRERKYLFFPEEKGEQYLKKENIWRRKIFGPRRRRRRMKKEKKESFGGEVVVIPTDQTTNQPTNQPTRQI